MTRQYCAAVAEANVRREGCRLRLPIRAGLLENFFTCVILRAIALTVHYSDQGATRITPIQFTERAKTAR